MLNDWHETLTPRAASGPSPPVGANWEPAENEQKTRTKTIPLRQGYVGQGKGETNDETR